MRNTGLSSHPRVVCGWRVLGEGPGQREETLSGMGWSLPLGGRGTGFMSYHLGVGGSVPTLLTNSLSQPVLAYHVILHKAL